MGTKRLDLCSEMYWIISSIYKDLSKKSGDPGDLPEACFPLMALYPLDNYSLSQVVSETSALYNPVNKLRVRLEALDAFQTCFDGETCGQTKLVSQGTLSRGKFL